MGLLAYGDTGWGDELFYATLMTIAVAIAAIFIGFFLAAIFASFKLSKIKIRKFQHYRDDKYPDQGDRISNDLNLLKDAGKKLPFLNGVNFHIIKEEQTRWLNFLAKKIDLLEIPKDNYSQAIETLPILSIII